MKYLLDSNIVSDFYNQKSENHAVILQQISSLTENDKVFISVLTIYEMEYGYANAQEEKREVIRSRINDAVSDFYVLPLLENGAYHFGQLKKSIKDSRSLSKEAIKKHSIDIMLASTAIIKSCILVSNDTIYKTLQDVELNFSYQNWCD